jgi:hypothetical protein
MKIVRTSEILATIAMAHVLCFPRPAPATDWLDQAEGLLAFTSNARSAIRLLESLPVPERQTAAYHAVLARACRAADSPGPAADAVAIHSALTGGAADADRELRDLRTWLERTGREQFSRILSEVAGGVRRPSLRSYLLAVTCHPPIIAADCSGLNETLLAALERGARSRPDRTAYLYQLGWMYYRLGRIDSAVRAFEDYLTVEADPYKQWRARFWSSRIRWEIAAALDAEAHERERTERSARIARRPPGADPSADGLARTARPAGPQTQPEASDDLTKVSSPAAAIPLQSQGAVAPPDAAGAAPGQATETSSQR